jgi:dinuclear metal center YbgI/SA1388 family protein
VSRIVSGVTASRALIEAAIAERADAILVHHGLFWRGQDGRLTGWLGERVRLLMKHDINLIAYHLPLDAHPTHGNNAQLGLRLGLQPDARFGEQQLGCIGSTIAHSLAALAQTVEQALHRVPTVVQGDGRPLRRVAWCTGGAQGYFEAAIAAGADAFITGEISEPQAHLACETGVAFMACGHHATERYGAPAVAQAAAQHFGLEHEFIEVDNPA